MWADLGLKEGINLGFFTLRYYSLAYIAGLFLAYWHLSKMIKEPGSPMAQRHVDDLFFYCTLGVILGGRLGYAAFYKPHLFTSFAGDGFVSWELLRLWDGGMSFHGGALGVLAAIIFVSLRGKLNLIRVMDYISVNAAFGMMLGRIANFINGELWGRVAGPDVPWAMVFPGAGPEARHPSQLYQAGLEGLLLIIIMLPLFWKTKARWRPGLMVGIFLTVISLGRFTAEFYREPDAHLSEFAVQTGLSMGQWLSLPMAALGIGLVIWSLTRKSTTESTPAEA